MTVDFNKIKEAVEKRNQFLAENPHMQVFQDEIEIELRKAGNSNNKMAVLHRMMRERLNKMVELWQEFK